MELFNIDFDSLDVSLEKTAYELMNDWVVWSNTTPYRIAELEFYIRSATHDDNYTHGHPLQQTNGKWYMHGSGIDITCGSDDHYGGILIRALQSLANPSAAGYVYGPITCTAKLFEGLDTVLLHNFSFGLAKDETGLIANRETPIAAPRVGLASAKNPAMFGRHYRFLFLPKRKHADKTAIEQAMRMSGKYTDEEIKAIWG